MQTHRYLSFFYTALLLALILCAVFCRFYALDWDSGALLHPDEYGLTNTLTRLSTPRSLSDYFNTRLSPLSPYDKYDLEGSKTADGPDNHLRWGQLPVTLIRLSADALGLVEFAQIRVLGRFLSALFDCLTLLLIFLIGKRLFHWRVGLLATALSSLAVQQIQQSHFMTVDNFGLFFCTLTLWLASCLALADPQRSPYPLSALSGIALGMAMSCKINLALAGIMLIIALCIRYGRFMALGPDYVGHVAWEFRGLGHRSPFRKRQIRLSTGLSILIALLSLCLSFRFFQPMSFRAQTGNTSFLTWQFNPDWWQAMQQAVLDSGAKDGLPPSEQWTNRPAILFPLINMLYGMGLPLALSAWLCTILACLRLLKPDLYLRSRLLLPVSWTLFFFLIMGTRVVKNNRYFLPVYPTLCLTAAWGCTLLWRSALTRAKRIAAASLITILLAGSAAWAASYVTTIYAQKNTRVEATEWIYQNLPAGSLIGVESWDEALPLHIMPEDPFGQQYRNVTLEVRWPDDGLKRDMFIYHLEQLDYLVISSQRAMWSVCRLPQSYPMTMAYYQALFNGELGFELIAQFQRPFKFAGLNFSDLTGSFTTGKEPEIPPAYLGLWGAEEAFSVYDHAPVWIFRKTSRFNQQKIIEFFRQTH